MLLCMTSLYVFSSYVIILYVNFRAVCINFILKQSKNKLQNLSNDLKTLLHSISITFIFKSTFFTGTLTDCGVPVPILM